MVSRSGISECEFHEVFRSLDECVLAAFDQGIARLSRALTDAAECEDSWLARIDAALSALLVFLEEQPRWARILILESPIAARVVGRRRRQMLGELARALEHETRELSISCEPSARSSQLTAELIVGGVFSVIHARLLIGPGEAFIELAPSLMSFIVASYIGSEGGRELERMRAKSGLRPERLPVRATYRTTRVLKAIGECPRLSNREIAEAAGLTDEGQTSKLLRRLEQRGLVHNVGLGQPYGGSNAWLLTPAGERVLESTRHSLVPGVGAVTARRARGAA